MLDLNASNQAPPKEEKEEKEEKDDKDEDSDVDSRFILDASIPNGNFKPAVEGPKLPARNKLSFNQMSSSYGKGFAMLQKMGFTGGGLGKHNDGIANPIEVQKRQSKRALQDDGEMVDQDLYGNEGGCVQIFPLFCYYFDILRPLIHEIYSQWDSPSGGRRTVEELLSIGKAPEKSNEPKISDGWKRDGKPKKPKTVYKTAEENAGRVNLAPLAAQQKSFEIKDAEKIGGLQQWLSFICSHWTSEWYDPQTHQFSIVLSLSYVMLWLCSPIFILFTSTWVPSGDVPAMRIVDMRGPEVKVASSFAELAASLSGPSLLHVNPEGSHFFPVDFLQFPCLYDLDT